MALPNFKPHSFGTFLETIRKSPVRHAEPASTSSPFSLLPVFSGQKEIEIVVLQALSKLPPGEFALALSDLKSRGLISLTGTIAALTDKGANLLAMLR